MSSTSDIGTLRIHTSGNADSATNLMYNLNLIRTAFNDAFDTATGHDHDTVNSKGVSGGITGFTFVESFLKLHGMNRGGL